MIQQLASPLLVGSVHGSPASQYSQLYSESAHAPFGGLDSLVKPKSAFMMHKRRTNGPGIEMAPSVPAIP